MKNIAKDMLLGVAISDALGVPYEFLDRQDMETSPAKDMVGYGTHEQPPGTWSDDSSLTFCLAEAMLDGYTLKSTALNFIKWKNQAYWTARNRVFDIGMTTARSITRLESIVLSNDLEDFKLLKYEGEEYDNGNGSLMRILPLLFEIKGKPIKDQFDVVWENSALTHRHIRAGMSCMIYLKLIENLIDGHNKQDAYEKTRVDIQGLWEIINLSEHERLHFERVIQSNLNDVAKKDIKSGGYVIESLEASIWCFLKTNTYEEAVLTAINFGHDTDTTGAITGGIAGVYYKSLNFPEYWIVSLARMEDILDLADRLNNKYNVLKD